MGYYNLNEAEKYASLYLKNSPVNLTWNSYWVMSITSTEMTGPLNTLSASET